MTITLLSRVFPIGLWGVRYSLYILLVIMILVLQCHGAPTKRNSGSAPDIWTCPLQNRYQIVTIRNSSSEKQQQKTAHSNTVIVHLTFDDPYPYSKGHQRSGAVKNFHSQGFVVSKIGEPYLWQSKPHLVPGSLQQRKEESIKGMVQFSLTLAAISKYFQLNSGLNKQIMIVSLNPVIRMILVCFTPLLVVNNIFLLVVVISPIEVNSVFLLLVT